MSLLCQYPHSSNECFEKDSYSVQKKRSNLTVLLLITEMNHATESNNYTVIGMCAREKNRN